MNGFAQGTSRRPTGVAGMSHLTENQGMFDACSSVFRQSHPTMLGWVGVELGLSWVGLGWQLAFTQHRRWVGGVEDDQRRRARNYNDGVEGPLGAWNFKVSALDRSEPSTYVADEPDALVSRVPLLLDRR